MHKFSDTKGREWGVELNGYTIQKVHRDCDVWLTDLPNVQGGEQSLLSRLLSPPYVLLVQVLWSLCEEQAKSAQVSEQDFATGLGGDTLENASEALSATVADFFTSPGQRSALKTLLEKTKLTATLLETHAQQAIENLNVELLAKSITEFSSKPAESAESSPSDAA